MGVGLSKQGYRRIERYVRGGILSFGGTIGNLTR